MGEGRAGIISSDSELDAGIYVALSGLFSFVGHTQGCALGWGYFAPLGLHPRRPVHFIPFA